MTVLVLRADRFGAGRCHGAVAIGMAARAAEESVRRCGAPMRGLRVVLGLLGLLGLLAFAGSPAAAAMPVKPPPPPAAGVYDWTGLHVARHIGHAPRPSPPAPLPSAA